MLLTFVLVMFGWIIFRSTGMPSLLHYVQAMCQWGTLRACYQFFTLVEMWPMNLYILIMLVVEWLQRGKEHGLVEVNGLLVIKNGKALKAVIYALLLLLVMLLGGVKHSFIYFQF